MSELSKAAEAAKARMGKENPSVASGKTSAERKRIPLSVPQRKLEVPDIPGYHLRWFRGTPSRLAQAVNAGYEFVTEEEVSLNSVAVGGDAFHSGNSDMGSRVSVVEGSEVDGSGQAVRLYLMKQPLEMKKEDDEIVQKRNDSVVEALTAGYNEGRIGAGQSGETSEDVAARYVDKTRTRIPELFRRKNRR